jgi:nucleotide-binding universal stress UspA family protein
MKRILCPTDFSATATNAIEYAATFASSRKAELVLYHARLMFNLTVADTGGLKDDTLEEASHRLDKLSKDISKKYGVPCYAEIEPTVRGLGKSIGDKTEDFDIVIMGTNGEDHMTQFFKDSNAYSAVVRSHIPLLIIPKNCRYKPVKNILYAYDYGKKRKLPMDSLKNWIEGLTPNVMVLQVMEDAFEEQEEKEARTFERITFRQHADTLKGFQTVFSADTAGTIHQHVLDSGYDALALCLVERNFIEGLFHKSVIRQLCTQANYPLFILHE